MQAQQIEQLLAEYMQLPTEPPQSIEVPQMPVKVSSLTEAQETQALIEEIRCQNVAARREFLEAVGRRTKIEDAIRGAMTMNVWVPFWVNDELLYVGFETTDWPMHRPQMMIRKEGEELRPLRHRITN